jgi:hypothetical protein
MQNFMSIPRLTPNFLSVSVLIYATVKSASRQIRAFSEEIQDVPVVEKPKFKFDHSWLVTDYKHQPFL